MAFDMNHFPGKKIVLLALPALFAWAGCKEKPLSIPDSTVGKRKVLVEELTGVDCPNCPAGTQALGTLSGTYGKDLVIVSIHAGARGSFNKQLPGAAYNFNTNELEQLVPVIGEPSAFPSAAINRQEANGDPTLFYEQPWGGLIAQEFGQDFNVALFLENKFDAVSRELEVEVRIAPEADLVGTHHLTVYMVQDSIIDPQNVFGTLTPNYVHRHVLREVLTNVSGDAIDEPLTKGAVVTRTFTYTLPADFDEHHGYVVAFVHHSGGPDKEVLQVEEKHIIE